MATTELNDSQHYITFKGEGAMRTGNAWDLRPSEFTLATMRSAGLLDRMVDDTVPPTTDRLWLDKNTDPAVLKEWDSIGSAWMPMTFERIFERAAISVLSVTGGTPNNIIANQPSVFVPNRLYSVTPSASSSGAVSITVIGVGAFPVTYVGGGELDEGEFSAGRPSLLIFRNGAFEVLFGYSLLADANEAVMEALDAAERAEQAAAGVNLPVLMPTDAGRALVVKSDGSGYETANIDIVHSSAAYLVSASYRPKSAPNVLTTAGFYTAGDRGGAQYRKVAAQPGHTGKIYITLADNSTVWYEIITDRANVLMFGAWNDGNSRLLSTLFPSIAAAQRLLPSATSLTEQVNDVAVNAAISYALAKSQTFFGWGPFANAFPVYFPEGGFYLTSVNTITKTCHIYGAGQYTSSLLFAGNKGIVCDVADHEVIEIHDLGLLPVVPNAGTALSLTGASGGDFRNTANVYRISILSWSANYWTKGVVIQHIGDSKFEDIEIKSSDTSHWHTSAFEIGTRCIDNHWRRCVIQGAVHGWLIAGNQCEGFRVEDCSCVAVNYGVRKTSTADVRPHWAIRGSHIAANRSCIDLTYASSVFISDMLCYLTDQAGQPIINNVTCWAFGNCSGVNINNFELGAQGDSFYQRGIIFQNCLNISVVGGYFAYFDNGILVDSTTQNGSILYPRSFTVAQLIANNSSSVIVKTT